MPHYSPQLVERWSCVSSPLLSHTPHRSRIGTTGGGAWWMCVVFVRGLGGVSQSTFWRQGYILDPVMFIFYFVRLPLCNIYSDYIVTFISVGNLFSNALPWQRLVPEWCDCKYRKKSWTVKEYCSLFIGTGPSLWGITIIPLIKVYNNDSNSYGLKGHSIFKSVCISEASWTASFGISYKQLQPKLLLPAWPSATKHGPNSSPFAVLDRFS
jgi:hypothetical protein